MIRRRFLKACGAALAALAWPWKRAKIETTVRPASIEMLPTGLRVTVSAEVADELAPFAVSDDYRRLVYAVMDEHGGIVISPTD